MVKDLKNRGGQQPKRPTREAKNVANRAMSGGSVYSHARRPKPHCNPQSERLRVVNGTLKGLLGGIPGLKHQLPVEEAKRKIKALFRGNLMPELNKDAEDVYFHKVFEWAANELKSKGATVPPPKSAAYIRNDRLYIDLDVLRRHRIDPADWPVQRKHLKRAEIEASPSQPAKATNKRKRAVTHEPEEERQQVTAPVQRASAPTVKKQRRAPGVKQPVAQQRQQQPLAATVVPPPQPRPKARQPGALSRRHAAAAAYQRARPVAAGTGAVERAIIHPTTALVGRSVMYQAPRSLLGVDCYWLNRTGYVQECWSTIPDAIRSTLEEQKYSIASCFQCGFKHVAHPCRNGHCNRSFCSRCNHKYYYLFDLKPGDPHFADLQAYCSGQCPFCVGICSSKECLQSHERGGLTGVPPPALTPKEEVAVAVEVVTHTKGLAQEILRVNDAEVEKQPISAGVTVETLMAERILCNNCATTIEDVHYHCRACNHDICPSCSKDVRQVQGGGACLSCGTPGLKLKRFIGADVLQLLSQADSILQQHTAGLPRDNGHNQQQPPLDVIADINQRLGIPMQQQQQQQQQGLNNVVPDSDHEEDGSDVDVGGPMDSAPAAIGNGSNGISVPGTAIINGNVPQNGWLAQTRAVLQNAANLNGGSGSVFEGLTNGGPLHNGAYVHSRFVDLTHSDLPMEYQVAPQGKPAKAAPSVQHKPSNGTSGIVKNVGATVDNDAWWKKLQPEDYRLAAKLPDGSARFIWTPHVSAFGRETPSRRAATMKLFVERWEAGEPIIIRGFRGRMNWGPEVMAGNAKDVRAKLMSFNVIDCKTWKSVDCDIGEFFAAYSTCTGEEIKGTPMLKLKDYPSDGSFAERCTRHCDDFIEMLNTCLPEYMHPVKGAANLATMLPTYTIAPDLGPKAYIAFGREQENQGDGDSVTKLHEDLSDAINILCHVQHPAAGPPREIRCGEELWQLPGYHGAGAVWDLFRREDLPILRRFLTDVIQGKVPDCPKFMHKGREIRASDNLNDVIHDQCFMLTTAHRKILEERYNVSPWHIEQYEWEGVLVPAGSPHQVRNLRSCIKTALDFVTPQNVHQCVGLREESRRLAILEKLPNEEDPADRHFSDKLQVNNMILFSLAEKLQVLKRHLGGNDVASLEQQQQVPVAPASVQEEPLSPQM